MKRTTTIRFFVLVLALIVLAQLVACGGQSSASSVETAVAATVAAMPAGDNTNVIQVTQVKEVTRISVIQYSPTPRPTNPPTPTLAPTETLTPAPTGTPRPPAPGDPTAAITIEPSGEINLTLNQFLTRYKSMTDLQKQEYVVTLPGKTVKWMGEVENVTVDGTVELRNLYSGGSVILIGIPTETAVKIDRNMVVDFTGMIQSFSGNISPEITIVDVKILRAYHPPTATPTATFGW